MSALPSIIPVSPAPLAALLCGRGAASRLRSRGFFLHSIASFYPASKPNTPTPDSR
ncbi:MAG: hypothetical protein ACKOHM_11015 [Spartobacteria bacterium]